MLKVSTIVNNLLQSSELGLEAMRSGILNLSSYADSIHKQVEKETQKNVKKATIVVALSRLQKNLKNIPSLRPVVYLEELSVKSPLADVTFEKIQATIEKSRSLAALLYQHDPQFFTITQGINELTIVVSQEQLDLTLEHFGTQPKALSTNLVGITVRFSQKYISEPNVIYSILSTLAAKRVNITEIISTYTELTVIVQQSQLEVTIQTLNQFFIKSE